MLRFFLSRDTLRCLRVFLLGVTALLAGAACRPARADVTLSPLFSDGAVLQRDAPLNIWGDADPGEVVTVQLGRQTAQTTAQDGHWLVRLRPMHAARRGELTLTVQGRNTLRVPNLVLGEVWVCAGQSNMEMVLNATDNAREVAATSADPDLRAFRVERATGGQPTMGLTGRWLAASPQNTPGFSAVAYYFGRRLRSELQVPVGLIVSAWSGTRAESWTSLPVLQELNARVGGFDSAPRQIPDAVQQQVLYEQQLAEWRASGGSDDSVLRDTGISAEAAGFPALDADLSAWTPLTTPGAWENTEGVPGDGARWFRREVTLSDAWAGKDLTLSLGAIDDYDQTFWNGEPVGHIGEETNRYWVAPRRYTVPGRLVRPGRNVIAVRVFDHGGFGGLMGPESAMRLERPADPSMTSVAPPNTGDDALLTIPLSGIWLSRWESRAMVKPTPPRPLDPNTPSALYNAMIAPLAPYAVKGFTWYQGEANAVQAWRYNYLLPALIAEWRRTWGRGDLPFYVVQLAPYTRIVPEPGESNWAELREAQRQTVQHTPETALVVITDAGSETDIHPRRKEPAGERLGLAALALSYGYAIEWSGPQLERADTRDAEIWLHFAHAHGLHASDNGPLQGFTMAGADRVFHPAEARIEGENVVLSSAEVPAPIAARYGWANFPVVNLVNGTELPASPFRTDDFPLSTAPREVPPPTVPLVAALPDPIPAPAARPAMQPSITPALPPAITPARALPVDPKASPEPARPVVASITPAAATLPVSAPSLPTRGTLASRGGAPARRALSRPATSARISAAPRRVAVAPGAALAGATTGARNSTAPRRAAAPRSAPIRLAAVPTARAAYAPQRRASGRVTSAR